MDWAAKTIEKIWYRAKALQRIEWMRNNAKLMREKRALDAIYRTVDAGGDGVHSFDEFEAMFRVVDPDVTTCNALQYFNRILDDRRRRFAKEAAEKRLKEEQELIDNGIEIVEEEDDDDEEDEDEMQNEWEISASPKQVMLFHTLHGNEALVELKSSLVRMLVDRAEERTYAPLEFLFHQGDKGDGKRKNKLCCCTFLLFLRFLFFYLLLLCLLSSVFFIVEISVF